MRRRRTIAAAVTLLMAAGCGSSGASSTSGSETPPPGAPEVVERYVEALNARDTEGLLAVGAAPDKPWSREQADALIQSKGGKGLTITNAPIRYERMGDYMGKVNLTAADREGRRVRETVDLVHESSRWHLVLFEWPAGDKASSAP